MAETAAEILERGSFYLHIRGGAHLVLSPEGDSHRLIRLGAEPGGGLCGTIVAVTARPSTLLRALPASAVGEAMPAVAGEYRLKRNGAGTELAFTPSDRFSRTAGLGDPLRPLPGRGLWRIAVRHPRASAGGCPVLPPPLARRLTGRAMVPADPPDFLDYPGVQLLITPASAHAVLRYAAPTAAGARP